MGEKGSSLSDSVFHSEDRCADLHLKMIMSDGKQDGISRIPL